MRLAPLHLHYRRWGRLHLLRPHALQGRGMVIAFLALYFPRFICLIAPKTVTTPCACSRKHSGPFRMFREVLLGAAQVSEVYLQWNH